MNLLGPHKGICHKCIPDCYLRHFSEDLEHSPFVVLALEQDPFSDVAAIAHLSGDPHHQLRAANDRHVAKVGRYAKFHMDLTASVGIENTEGLFVIAFFAHASFNVRDRKGQKETRATPSSDMAPAPAWLMNEELTYPFNVILSKGQRLTRPSSSAGPSW